MRSRSWSDVPLSLTKLNPSHPWPFPIVIGGARVKGRRPGQRVGPQRFLERPTALGTAVERARYDKRLTLAELAAASKLSLRTVKAIVAGEGNAGINWRTKLRLNEALFGSSYTDPLGALAKSIEQERQARAAKGAVPSTAAAKGANHDRSTSKGAARRRTAPLAIAKGAVRSQKARGRRT